MAEQMGDLTKRATPAKGTASSSSGAAGSEGGSRGAQIAAQGARALGRSRANRPNQPHKAVAGGFCARPALMKCLNAVGVGMEERRAQDLRDALAGLACERGAAVVIRALFRALIHVRTGPAATVGVLARTHGDVIRRLLLRVLVDRRTHMLALRCTTCC